MTQIFTNPTPADPMRTAVSAAELIDIYPTLASLCGLHPPAYLDGTDLTPALQDPAKMVKTAAFSQLRRPNGDDGYPVRAGKWRNTEWTSGGGADLGKQLFDEESDPAETKNLAADPAFASQIMELSSLIVPIRNQQPAPRTARPTPASKE